MFKAIKISRSGDEFYRRISIVAFLCLTGCGTLMQRMDPPSGRWVESGYYQAVRWDIGLLTGNVQTGYFPATLFCWMSIICPVVIVVSLPADIVIDTLVLPFEA